MTNKPDEVSIDQENNNYSAITYDCCGCASRIDINFEDGIISKLKFRTGGCTEKLESFRHDIHRDLLWYMRNIPETTSIALMRHYIKAIDLFGKDINSELELNLETGQSQSARREESISSQSGTCEA